MVTSSQTPNWAYQVLYFTFLIDYFRIQITMRKIRQLLAGFIEIHIPLLYRVTGLFTISVDYLLKAKTNLN